MGQLWTWAQCFPDLWDRMCERVPGAASAARYAKTELYSYGETSKPSNVASEEAWKVHIQHLLAQHPEGVRRAIARKMREMVRRHYKRTGGLPILPFAAHPDSGLSWETLAMIAERADLKHRRKAFLMVAAGTPEFVRAKRAYEREFATLFPERAKQYGIEVA